MIDALSIAGTGLSANQAWIDSISNNVANMQTIGYKRSEVNFRDMVREVSAHGNAGLLGAKVYAGAGIQTFDPVQVFTPGTIRATQNAYDMSIQGAGFFEVALATGELAYTRNGRFHLDANGQLALANGETLSADLRIPPDVGQVTVKADGTVEATVAETGEVISIGQIHLANFSSAERLQKGSDGLYRSTEWSGLAAYSEPGRDGQGYLLQGAVEMSNVNLIEEMSSLVLAQRAYQMNARLLQASDQILETINNLRR